MLKSFMDIIMKRLKSALNILNDEQISAIKTKLNKGGRKWKKLIGHRKHVRSCLKNPMTF